MKKARIESYLTPDEILRSASGVWNPFLYHDGCPVSATSRVVKFESRRCAVAEPNGGFTPVIRQNAYISSRQVFFDGSDVPNTLTVHNPHPSKHKSSYVIVNGRHIPVFKKGAIAHYVLADTETNENILPETPIELVGKNEIRTIGTNKTLYRKYVSSKSSIPGYENLFDKKRPAEEITQDNEACSELEDNTTTLPPSSSSTTPSSSDNTGKITDEFVFTPDNIPDDDEDVNPYPLRLFERKGMKTPPPTIQDLSNTKIFTPGEEGSEFLPEQYRH